MKLSGLGMTHRIRENGCKISIFDKVSRIKKQLKDLIPELDQSGLIQMLSHCRNFYNGTMYCGRRTSDKEEQKRRKQKQLTQMEKMLYDFLISNKLNPATTYRWFLATRVPFDIQNKLESGQVSVKLAMKTSYNRKRVRESNVGLVMMEEMRTIIGGL